MDTGAGATLITTSAVRRLKLKLHAEASPPLLKPLSPDAKPYQSLGRVNLQLQVDNGPLKWARAVVVNFGTKWDVLVGRKTLERLGVETMTPAMQRRLQGAGAVRDHPGKQVDHPELNVTTAVSDAYEQFPSADEAHDLACTVPNEPAPEALPAEPVVSRPMRAHFALATGFFVPQRDADFTKWNALYPSTTAASVRDRLHHQCSSPASARALQQQLMTGADALREYPGGCPPPAAYAPIRPPMREKAVPVYTAQHPLSLAAQEARDKVTVQRIQYGVDESSTAFAQLPVFTQAKPGTSERRVLFDDSANNSLNMLSVGMQLPTPTERLQFLRDARLVSSVDMASFFTQLRLADDVADFWTFDGGCCGKVRTKRMVQGNSESPAIAQAFILHVLAPVHELHNKLLVYIDNVYIKSTSGDEQEHIDDVGAHVRCLAAANITINMRKSLWCASRDVEVLGRAWSADRVWKPFDHRVESLQSLPMPRTVSQIRRMNGGINAISEHIPGSQYLLAPFYAATSKTRLTRADLEDLREPWQDLKQALLAVESLFVPPPGVPLVLRTDAARAGVGAVLLAQRSADPDDLAPVCYFSRVFGGQQGRKHSTWREVCAVYEAVKYFYPYLDGCANLRIETDCGTVVSLFAHKTENDGDQLAQFKVALTALGVKKSMLFHRPGVKQETADWLSRAKEWQRPRKQTTSSTQEPSIGGPGVVYEIGYLSVCDDEGEDTNAEGDDDEHDDVAHDDDEDEGSEGNDAEHSNSQQQRAALEQTMQLPRPSQFTDCQEDDEEIQAWITLCQAREQLVGEATPEFRAIATKQLRDGILYELVGGSGTRDAVGTWVPTLTRRAARRYIRQCHAALAHAGQTRLHEFVARQVWCPSLTALVCDICRTCHTCQVTAIQTLTHTPMVMSRIHAPREHIYLDFAHIGDRGEPAMDALVVVDSASGFMQAFPILDQTAATLVETLEQEWFNVYGPPCKLTSDNGRQLTSTEFRRFLDRYQVQHILTSPYHPQSDLAEAAVKKLKTSLQRCWADVPNEAGWTQFLPRITAAYALTQSESTGMIPAALFFGPEASQPSEAFVVCAADDPGHTAEQLQRRLCQQMEEHRTMVRSRANARANQQVRIRWFEPGEWVTIRRVPRAANLADWFTRREGPYRVVARYGPTYQLAYADGVLFPRTVPGDAIMAYHYAEGTDPALLGPPSVSPSASSSSHDASDTDDSFGDLRWPPSPVARPTPSASSWSPSVQHSVPTTDTGSTQVDMDPSTSPCDTGSFPPAHMPGEQERARSWAPSPSEWAIDSPENCTNDGEGSSDESDGHEGGSSSDGSDNSTDDADDDDDGDSNRMCLEREDEIRAENGQTEQRGKNTSLDQSGVLPPPGPASTLSASDRGAAQEWSRVFDTHAGSEGHDVSSPSRVLGQVFSPLHRGVSRSAPQDTFSPDLITLEPGGQSPPPVWPPPIVMSTLGNHGRRHRARRIRALSVAEASTGQDITEVDETVAAPGGEGPEPSPGAQGSNQGASERQ